jgi:thiol-disulfide isomerase/thioredoxin
MRNNKLLKGIVLAILIGSPMLSHAQLLKGVIQGQKVEEVGFTFSPSGDPMENAEGNATVAADGSFTFNPSFTSDWLDVSVLIGDNDLFGVHLVKGKTVQMLIKKTAKGYDVKFTGNDADISYFVNRDIQAFDNMKYFSPDPAEAKSNAAYRSLLDKEYNSTVGMLKFIKNKEMRSYYSKYAEKQYRWMKMRIIMDKAYDDKTDYKKNAEFISLIKDVDINDDMNFRTALSLTALVSAVNKEMKGSNEEYCYEMMKVVNDKVTNPKLRRMMVRIVCNDYFTYGDGSGDTKSFIPKLEAFAGKDNDIVAPFKQMAIAKEKTKNGKMAPDITLNTVDGKQVQLKDLLKGKLTYIDVWATWCGPCCKEIPHLEKLVEKFKGNNKVQFISISTDQSVDAWKAKLAKDKPQWAQYILTPENDKKFCEDWAIAGIPRFIMIDSNGQIFSSNASRPSEDETAKTIAEQTK